jgi:putative ABC transport system substrate-binding protein
MLEIRRREFITFLGGAAAWPLAARAQQPKVPVVGYLSAGTAASDGRALTAFREGLDQGGYVEGRNVEILFRKFSTIACRRWLPT